MQIYINGYPPPHSERQKKRKKIGRRGGGTPLTDDTHDSGF